MILVDFPFKDVFFSSLLRIIRGHPGETNPCWDSPTCVDLEILVDCLQSLWNNQIEIYRIEDFPEDIYIYIYVSELLVPILWNNFFSDISCLNVSFQPPGESVPLCLVEASPFLVASTLTAGRMCDCGFNENDSGSNRWLGTLVPYVWPYKSWG